MKRGVRPWGRRWGGICGDILEATPQKSVLLGTARVT